MQAEIISLASRRAAVPGSITKLEKQDAIARLRLCVPSGSIIYIVLRVLPSRSDVQHCDFYLIDGDRISRVSDDVALALDRRDADGASGVRVLLPLGRETLRDLVDFSLSRLLFGERARIRHQVIR